MRRAWVPRLTFAVLAAAVAAVVQEEVPDPFRLLAPPIPGETGSRRIEGGE